MTTVETTVEAQAREALALLVARHDLPRPLCVDWDAAVLQVSLHCDADADRWASAMLRKADEVVFGPHRSYGFSVQRWMGVGVALVVSHDESRVRGLPS